MFETRNMIYTSSQPAQVFLLARTRLEASELAFFEIWRSKE